MKILEFYNKVDNSVGVAKILFNYLSQKYPSKKVKDIAKTTSGGTPNRSMSVYYGGNISWIKSGELNDSIITVSEETITEDALKNSSAKLYPKGTLVLALYGATVGKTGILGFESASNQAVCAVYPEKGISKEYLFWFFRQKRLEYIQQSFGGAQPNISQDVVKNTDVPVPPLDVQESVQKLLFHIEKTKRVMDVEGYTAIIPQLKEFILTKEGYDTIREVYIEDFELISQLRQSILQEAVSGKIVPQNPKDESASELLKKIKSERQKLINEGKIRKEKQLSPISEDDIPYQLPKGWEWVRLGDLGETQTGTTPSTTKSEYFGGIIPFIKPADICPNGINYSNGSLTEEGLNQGRLIPPDSLMMVCIGGSTGKSYYSDRDCSCNQQINTIKGLCGLSGKFLFYFTASPYFQGRVWTQSTGSATNIINKQKWASIPFPLPPLSEQRCIIEKVDQLMKLCDELEAKIKENQTNSELLMEAVLKEAFESNVSLSKV